ncbi:Universal stress protein family protein [Variovorax sp. OK605]|uniref:universal stress protein n=1 Tax=Variovorax sp. OK605 TaxID=1855317 RepID=UPI0008F392EA|nr:universal stress protein [Variovorax sp. OK605]SFQ59930.1 Universal stress protein family protein [Variovorax sp. OK605]
MTLSTIAVHLDHTERCEQRTVLATRLAKAHGSHLCAIVPTGVGHGAALVDMGSSVGSIAAADRLIAAASLHLRRRAETVAHVFRCRIKELGCPSFDVCLVDGEPLDALLGHGRACDLLIVGQVDAAATVVGKARHMHEEAMLHSGRPVLIVPRTGDFACVGQRVLVAWDGSREAAMAVRGALPLLRRAAQVTLVSMPPDDDQDTVGRWCIPQTTHWLMRHGIDARTLCDRADGRIADGLVARARSLQADPVVMGGYGHSRARERTLGGVTREMLAQAGVPVLMAH